MMRTFVRAAVLVVGAGISAGVARAQDASMMAMQASQQAMDMAMQASQMAMQMAMMNNDGFSLPVPRPGLPMTPRPMISPDGRSFKSGVRVVLYDADPKAIVFYTMDGSLPTAGSQRYVGPIAVGSKVRVRAMAFDLEEMPSGVVSKTFRVKS
jgi:Chitobiase/beta-hexosaminidase C-terminal domain